jgi:non-heme chloroperoxidase
MLLRQNNVKLVQCMKYFSTSRVTKEGYDCIKAFSETDFTEDLKKFDMPTLIIHGDDDQIVPIGASALLSAKLIKDSALKVYPGGAHSLGDTSKEHLNADLLAFLKS